MRQTSYPPRGPPSPALTPSQAQAWERSAARPQRMTLVWARDGLSRKNALLEEDARLIEVAYQQRLLEIASPSTAFTDSSTQVRVSVRSPEEDSTAGLAFPKEPVRKRSKAHLSFVRGQPCLICKQVSSDRHHLKLAQPSAGSRHLLGFEVLQNSAQNRRLSLLRQMNNRRRIRYSLD